MPRPLSLAAGNDVKLTVSDTGDGIDASIMNRIFDHCLRKKAGEGTGMEFSVVYGIVKGCNGAITVESEMDKWIMG